jgi:hypothetical protein
VAAFERHPSVTSRKINRCSVNERDGEHDEEAHREEEIDGGNFESWMSIESRT